MHINIMTWSLLLYGCWQGTDPQTNITQTPVNKTKFHIGLQTPVNYVNKTKFHIGLQTPVNYVNKTKFHIGLQTPVNYVNKTKFHIGLQTPVNYVNKTKFHIGLQTPVNYVNKTKFHIGLQTPVNYVNKTKFHIGLQTPVNYVNKTKFHIGLQTPVNYVNKTKFHIGLQTPVNYVNKTKFHIGLQTPVNYVNKTKFHIGLHTPVNYETFAKVSHNISIFFVLYFVTWLCAGDYSVEREAWSYWCWCQSGNIWRRSRDSSIGRWSVCELQLYMQRCFEHFVCLHKTKTFRIAPMFSVYTHIYKTKTVINWYESMATDYSSHIHNHIYCAQAQPGVVWEQHMLSILLWG